MWSCPRRQRGPDAPSKVALVCLWYGVHTGVGWYPRTTREGATDLRCYLKLVCNEALPYRGRGHLVSASTASLFVFNALPGGKCGGVCFEKPSVCWLQVDSSCRYAPFVFHDSACQVKTFRTFGCYPYRRIVAHASKRTATPQSENGCAKWK